jgi:crotonobetainyl-CoA:carnitine CoA-transferase CaiB-like acyl-CoA transferase
MSDLGAEVIKVEPPGQGDVMRIMGRAKVAGRGLWWSHVARGKKCITLNLRVPEGQELARELVGRCDIVVENFRPGTLERWGLGYDELAARTPGLILARITGYGQTGPYRHRAGFGSVGEAMGGLRYVTGFPDRPPPRVGISLGDMLAGIFGLVGRSPRSTSATAAVAGRSSTSRSTRPSPRSWRARCRTTRSPA